MNNQQARERLQALLDDIESTSRNETAKRGIFDLFKQLKAPEIHKEIVSFRQGCKICFAGAGPAAGLKWVVRGEMG